MTGEQAYMFALGVYAGVLLWELAGWSVNRIAGRFEVARERQERARCAAFERLARRALTEVQLMERLRYKLGDSSNERQLDAILQIGTGAQAQLLLETIQEVDA